MRMTAMNCVYVQSMSDQAMTQAQQPIATGLHQRDAQKAAPFGHPSCQTSGVSNSPLSGGFGSVASWYV